MSKRRQRPESLAVCGLCGGQPRDRRYLCPACVAALETDLIELADWLLDELTTQVAQGSGRPGRSSTDNLATGISVNWAASEVRGLIDEWLSYAARLIEAEPTAYELSARADDIALQVHSPQIASALSNLVFRAKRLVDLPPDRVFLGDCAHCGDGKLYAEAGSPFVACDECRTLHDAEERRDAILARLDELAVTAAEAARLSAYLGIRASREAVRKRVNQWHKRGTIIACLGDEPTFRFGTVWRRLLREDASHLAS